MTLLRRTASRFAAKGLSTVRELHRHLLLPCVPRLVHAEENGEFLSPGASLPGSFDKTVGLFVDNPARTDGEDVDNASCRIAIDDPESAYPVTPEPFQFVPKSFPCIGIKENGLQGGLYLSLYGRMQASDEIGRLIWQSEPVLLPPLPLHELIQQLLEGIEPALFLQSGKAALDFRH